MTTTSLLKAIFLILSRAFFPIISLFSRNISQNFRSAVTVHLGLPLEPLRRQTDARVQRATPGWLKLLYHEWGWYIPADYFKEPKTLEIEGDEFQVPSNPKEYLSARYGDWQTLGKLWRMKMVGVGSAKRSYFRNGWKVIPGSVGCPLIGFSA